MDLQEFVKETLIQISEGVTAARAKKGGKIAPTLSINESAERVFLTEIPGGTGYLVSFNLAVTTKEKTEGGGKAGIQVVSFLNLEGGKTKGVESSTVSHVSFDVPISYDEAVE
jgi:hypothetical protein